MNLKIKFRESFRPFAPCVLQERAHEWFEMRARPGKPVHAAGAPVLEKHRAPSTAEQLQADARSRPAQAGQRRPLHVPAITHVDY